VGRPGKEIPLLIPRYNVEDNIKMNFRELAWGVMNWIELVQDKEQWRFVVDTVSLSVGEFLSSCTTGGFLRKAQLHEFS
jgi:hypothetical protein